MKSTLYILLIVIVIFGQQPIYYKNQQIGTIPILRNYNINFEKDIYREQLPLSIYETRSPHTKTRRERRKDEEEEAKSISKIDKFLSIDTSGEIVDPNSVVGQIIKNISTDSSQVSSDKVMQIASTKPELQVILPSDSDTTVLMKENSYEIRKFNSDGTVSHISEDAQERPKKKRESSSLYLFYLTVDGGVTVSNAHGESMDDLKMEVRRIYRRASFNLGGMFNVGLTRLLSAGAGFRTNEYGMTIDSKDAETSMIFESKMEFRYFQIPLNVTFGSCYWFKRKLNPFLSFEIIPSFLTKASSTDIVSYSRFTDTREVNLLNHSYSFGDVDASFDEVYRMGNIFTSVGGGFSIDISDFFSIDVKSFYDFSLLSREKVDREIVQKIEEQYNINYTYNRSRFHGYRGAIGFTINFNP